MTARAPYEYRSLVKCENLRLVQNVKPFNRFASFITRIGPFQTFQTFYRCAPSQMLKTCSWAWRGERT
jgi:hypothetical protein